VSLTKTMAVLWHFARGWVMVRAMWGGPAPLLLNCSRLASCRYLGSSPEDVGLNRIKVLVRILNVFSIYFQSSKLPHCN
jgi:hypothetical protein